MRDGALLFPAEGVRLVVSTQGLEVQGSGSSHGGGGFFLVSAAMQTAHTGLRENDFNV